MANYQELCWNTLSQEATLMINKKLISTLGLKEAVLLSDLLSKEKYFKDREMLEDGWFYNTQENRKEDTGLSFYYQTKVLENLREKSIIESKRQGLPARLYFRLDHKEIIKLLEIKGFNNNKQKGLIVNNNKLNNNKLSFSKEKDVKHHSQDPPNRRRKIKSSVKIPVPDDGNGDTLKVFNHWNGKGKPLTKHSPTSKVGSAALQVIARKLRNGLNPDQIVRAIDRYFDVLTSSDTWVSNYAGHLISLPEFFAFGRFTRDRMLKQKRPLGINNWFDVCNSNEDLMERFRNPIRLKKDNSPEVTEKIKKEFAKRVLCTSDPNYTVKELNGFIICSEKLLDYSQGIKEEYGKEISMDTLIRGLFKSLNGAFGDKIGIGNLASDFAVARLLPTYLNEQAEFIWLKAEGKNA